ncbi:MAG TPA: hypothetical protein DDX72_04170, partial [Ruminococcaceae bacterium]|nr:hypothetical protein [Oscillospiraceae bacterium]
MMTKWMKKTLAVLTASALAVGSAELLPDGISEGLTVSASAQEEEFSIYTNGVIARYKGTGGDVVIPSVINGITVTGIESYAFYNCKSITSITVPDTVTSIGSYAFKDCTSLTDITIPRTVTSIESGLFYNCTSLERITIPDTAVSIGDAAFSYCTGLKSISIPDSVTSIGKSAFEFCSSLAEVVIPDSVESIGAYAFTACKSIEQLVIPASVRTIGSCAFAGNDHYKTSLNQITFLGDNFSLPIDAIAQYEDYSKGVKCRTDLTVCAKSGTDAEKAAKRFGYKFIDLDSDKMTDYSEIKGCTEITLSLYEAYSDFLTEYYIEKFPEMALEPLLCIEDDHNFFKAVSANIIENSPEKSAPEALYDWMNDNISSPSFYFEEKGYPIDVYRYKTADCCGNANLLCELMRSAGIPAVVATGYVGDMTSEPERDFFVYTMGSSAINHAWVFYYDGGCWKVADSAWNLMLDNKNEIAENYYIIAVDDLAVDSDYYTPLASGGYLSVEKNGRMGYLSKSSTTSWTDGPGCMLIDPEEIFINPYFGGTINGVKQFYDIALGTGKFVTFEGRSGTGLGYVNKNGYLKVYNTLKTDGKTYWFGQNSTAYDITGYDTEMYYGRPVFKVGDKFEVKLVPENNEDLNCKYYTNYNHTEFDNSVGSVNESGIFTVNKPGSGSVYLLLENGEEPAGYFSFYAVDPTLYENIGLRSETGDGKITLTWDAAESAQKYIVKMLYNDVWVDVMTVNGNSNSAEITGLVNGQSYEFAVDVIPRFISDDSNSWFRYTTKNSVTSIPLQKTIDNIAVTAKPTKTTYFVGESLDLTGGKITVSYNYGDPVELELAPTMITGFDSTTAGVKTITVSYE